ncbi:hypothetical protein Lal_00033233 [Lupinus albus]|nr:hypothetical protein Lal_00033233 [Lupinus albus]
MTDTPHRTREQPQRPGSPLTATFPRCRLPLRQRENKLPEITALNERMEKTFIPLSKENEGPSPLEMSLEEQKKILEAQLEEAREKIEKYKLTIQNLNKSKKNLRKNVAAIKRLIREEKADLERMIREDKQKMMRCHMQRNNSKQ